LDVPDIDKVFLLIYLLSVNPKVIIYNYYLFYIIGSVVVNFWINVSLLFFIYLFSCDKDNTGKKPSLDSNSNDSIPEHITVPSN